MSASNRPYILGLTGGAGCGKTTAAAHLSSLGARVVDADAISRQITAPGGAALPAIREAFGGEVFGEDGALNRRALGDIVFADERRRRALEAIIHPAVQREMLRQVDQAALEGVRVAVLDVPLLYETGMDALCDEVWVMAVDAETQALRLMSRDRLTRAQADARIASQMPLEDKIARAAQVVKTHKQPQDVKRELDQLYRDLLKRI